MSAFAQSADPAGWLVGLSCFACVFAPLALLAAGVAVRLLAVAVLGGRR